MKFRVSGIDNREGKRIILMEGKYESMDEFMSHVNGYMDLEKIRRLEELNEKDLYRR